MTRQVEPKAPKAVGANLHKVPSVDFSFFDKLGDSQINAANNNFKLYAQNLLAIEQQKLFDQYSSDPVNLANALGKLPEMINDLPPEIQEQMQMKLYLDSVSLISKAQTNQNKKQQEEYKVNALSNADLTMKQIESDYFNVLQYITAEPDKKRKVDFDIYVSNRSQLNQLADLTDEKGKPLFSAKQQQEMRVPSKAILNGFKNFIYRADEKQLRDWDSKVFQNRDKFIKDTGITSAIYDSAEKMLTQRLKQLKDTKTRKIKSQAEFDTASLLADANNEEQIKELRKNTDAPKKLIDKIVKANNDIVKSNWYNPNQETDPMGAYKTLSVVSEIASDTDVSPEGLEMKIEKAADLLDMLATNGAKYNLSPEEIEQLRDWIASSIIDKGFAENIQMLDIKPFADIIIADMENNPAEYMPGSVEKFESELESYRKAGKIHPRIREVGKIGQTDVYGSVEHGWYDRHTARKVAYNNAKRDIYEALSYVQRTGDQQGAKSMLDQAKYNYIKKYNSDWIPESDFDKLQIEFEKGKKPLYYHNGVTWEYQGYQNNGVIFKVKI